MMVRRLVRSVPMIVRALLLTACLALAASGCGGGDEKPAASSGGGGGDKLAGPLKFAVTGGDAFREDRMTVQPDGSAQVTTQEGDVAVDLTAKELAEVNDQIGELEDVPRTRRRSPRSPTRWPIRSSTRAAR